MKINSINNSPSFTGFKLTDNTREGAIKLIKDITGYCEETTDCYGYKAPTLEPEIRKQMIESLQKDVIEPLKEIKAEVEYKNGSIIVRSADEVDIVVIDKTRRTRGHNYNSIVHCPVIGGGYVTLSHLNREEARRMHNNTACGDTLELLIMAREIARHFDMLYMERLKAEAAEKTYKPYFSRR